MLNKVKSMFYGIRLNDGSDRALGACLTHINMRSARGVLRGRGKGATCALAFRRRGPGARPVRPAGVKES